MHSSSLSPFSLPFRNTLPRYMTVATDVYIQTKKDAMKETSGG